MTDRWNPKRTTVAVEPPRNRIVVPGDVAGGPSVEPRGKSWGIRVRGDTGGEVKHVYRCPVHGEFEVMAPRAEVPDWQLCPYHIGEPRAVAMFGLDTEGRKRIPPHVCAIVSPWAGSRCGIGHAAGEVMS